MKNNIKRKDNIKSVTLVIDAYDDRKLEIPLEVWQVDVICRMLGLSVDVDQHIIIWHFRRIKLCRNNAGIFHPRTPGILVITVIEKIITVITRLKMGYFNFPDSANYGIK